MREAFACWQALRKLGFSADDIHFGLLGDVVLVSLQRGRITAAIPIDSWTRTVHGDFDETYAQACLLVHTASPDELDSNWKTSRIAANSVRLVTSLVGAGIALPCQMN